ncbi:MAG TPA: Rieske (2Fe-2S) protein [Candidatus Limnocylindrales bacterium]
MTAPGRTGARRQLPGSRRAELATAALFGLAALAGLALLAVYALDGPIQAQGLLLTVCLGGIGAAIINWVQRLMDIREVAEPRHALASDPRDVAGVGESLEEEAGFTRRRFLVGALLGALGGLAAAVAIPILSLGPAPGRSLFVTSWRKGLRIVRTDGTPVNRADLSADGILTVFPEGHVGEADAATLLIAVGRDLLRLPPDRQAWAPDGIVAYSKLCTHAGCPVGLYRASQHQLICPCHQSTFDVTDGARPIFGPAARPLPQLPIALQPDGTFVALGDYPEPVGPSFWDMG